MRLPALIAGLLLAASSSHALAERTSPRPAERPQAADARVIVKFKEGAASLRAHALSAQASGSDNARALEGRASLLGARHGLLLRAGAATGERMQWLEADPAHGLDARTLAARLAADPEVEYAEPVRRARRLAAPSDPLFATVSGAQGPAVGQWYLRAPAGEVISAINAVGAWDVHGGNRDVVVAVLDTGVRRSHPDLAGKLLAGYDFVSNRTIANDGGGRDADPSDPGDWLTRSEIDANPSFWEDCEASNSSWHGTQVAGIVAAATDNGVGMAGSGRHVRVLPLRVLGKCFGETPDINAAIRWAAGAAVPGVPNNPTPAKVINLSLGSGGACTADDQDAVNAALARGAVVVAAAGNSAGRAVGAPANCAGVIGVAALRHIGTKVGFSDVGPELEIAAPGGNCVNVGDNEPCLYPILTTRDSGTRGPTASSYSDGLNHISVGTSFSSPLVAGTAALLYSVKSAITPAQVLAALQSTARPFPASGAEPDPFTGAIVACRAPGDFDQLQCYCTTGTCGAGMLDADAAVRSLLGSEASLQPAVSAEPASAVAGQSVVLSSAGSLVPGGRSIAARRWSLIDGGGAVSALSGAVDGQTATLTPSAAGRVRVQLTLTDDRGLATSTDFGLDVAAASGGGGGGGADPPPPGNASGGGGGGGAMSMLWLVGLGLAAGLLARARGAALAAAVGWVLALPASSWAGAGERAVHGLIVQLRDAPAHAALAREQAQARAQGQTRGASAERERSRWQRVLAATPSLQAVRIAERRAVGESAQVLRFERPLSAAQAQEVADRLAQDGDVAWAVPNIRERRLQAAGNPPGDPFYPQQWWLQPPAVGSSGAPDFLSAWIQTTAGSADAIVAVLDSGIVPHPDLAGKVINGYDMVADSTFSNDGDGRDTNPADPGDWVDSADRARPEYASCDLEDSSWHGTAIAGMLAASVNNGVGGASINWNGRVLAVRVATKCGADVADIVDGMRWVAGLSVCLRSDVAGTCLETSSVLTAPRARVVNISFGGDGTCDAYQGTINELRARGVVIVAAAGNEHAAPTRPAKCAGVIGVVALNRDGYKSTYSNFGSSQTIASVGGDNHQSDDLWAEVADSGLLSVSNSGRRGPGAPDYSNYYGTSFSTPIVAGAVSLMLSVNPALTPQQIEDGLRRSARPHVTSSIGGNVAACSNDNPGRCLCTASTCGAGILDAPQALAYADALRLGNPYTRPTWPVVSIDSAALAAAAARGPDRPANPPVEAPAGGGGGGAMSAVWLLALGAAAFALRRRTALR